MAIVKLTSLSFNNEQNEQMILQYFGYQCHYALPLLNNQCEFNVAINSVNFILFAVCFNEVS